jgi:hypothetical protein
VSLHSAFVEPLLPSELASPAFAVRAIIRRVHRPDRLGYEHVCAAWSLWKPGWSISV